MKIFINSLGCPKNTVDTELMIGYLKSFNDITTVKHMENAEIILINTCGFITPAKEESIDAIMEAIEAKKENPNIKIVVAGCLYERYKLELQRELPEVDHFIGVYELKNITKVLLHKEFNHQKPYLLREIITPKHIGYLKIAEGCSNGCSFCAIPLIKGGFKSRNEDEIIEEAKNLTEKGVKELYIIAQDTTAYMFDKGIKNALLELLLQLEDIDNLKWIRLMYTYPSNITDELIEFISSSKKTLNYIDVPLQHISNNVLKSMNRQYTEKNAIELINKLKESNITIRSTFIVGYPNETEEDFQKLCNFIETYELDWVGFFKYYHEENTQAFKLEDLDDDTKTERLNIIENIQREIYEKKHSRFIGKEFEVIIDKLSDELPQYFETRMKRSAYEIDGIVFLEQNKKIKPGDIVKIKIDNMINNTDFVASLVKT